MREFNFYYSGDMDTTKSNRDFIKEINNLVNSDVELVNVAKKINLDFSQKVKEITANNENDLFLFTMVRGLSSRVPRYHYKKNLQHDGKNYEVEIDCLARTFSIYEI